MYKENDNTTEIRIKRPDEQWKAKPYKGSCVFDNGDGKCVKPRPDDDWMFHEGKAYLNNGDGTNPYYVSLDPWNHKRTSRCTRQGGPIGYQNSLLATLADIDSKLAGLPESGDMSTNAFTGTGSPVARQRTATDASIAKDNVGA